MKMRSVFLKCLSVVGAILLLSFLASRADFAKLKSETILTNESKEQPAARRSSTSANLSNSDLAQRINELIDHSEVGSARWGISVISLRDGSTFYSRNADKLFTPASNMKVFTTGVALDLLGADYQWRTSVYAVTQPDEAGTIRGDLILYGRGAPDFVSRANDGSLAKLVDDLYARGVRRITGNVIGDESYFRGNLLGDGWQWTDIQWYFGAEASALSINENEVDLNLLPPTKSGTPPEAKINDSSGLFTVDNRMAVSTNSAKRLTIGVYRGLSDNKLQVWGEFPPGTKGFGARLSVHNPALWAATLFEDALKSRGINVEGQVLARSSRVAPSDRFDPAKNVELAYVNSKPLAEIVRTTNKESNNLYAELILRTLGRERRAMIEAAEPPGRELGDDEAGLAIIRIWLERTGIRPGHLALHDGSGLSRLNLVTPEATAKLLSALTKTAVGNLFRESLPVAGKDGTLSGRLPASTGKVTAKTGSLTYDNSLSGFLTNSDGDSFAFSILCNDHTARGSSLRIIDQIVTMLVDFPATPPQSAQKH